MVNTLRRKMFKLGGSANTHGVGITSNLKMKKGGRVEPQATFGVGNNANKTNRARFQCIYNREEQILDGLNEFYNCAKFCTSEKPPKRQKRNDYESSDSRK